MSTVAGPSQNNEKPKKEVKWLQCNKCQATAMLRHKVQHKEKQGYVEPIYYEEVYCILRCCGCGTLSFYGEQWDEYNYDYCEDENGEVSIENFPITKHVTLTQLMCKSDGEDLVAKLLKPVEGSLAVEGSPPDQPKLVPPTKVEPLSALPHPEKLPEKVLKIYEETKKAYETNLPILASVGLRTILEAVLKTALKVDESTIIPLSNLITNYNYERKIEDSVIKALKEIVLWSNQAPHNATEMSEDLFRESWKLVMGLINYALVLPDISKNIPAAPRLLNAVRGGGGNRGGNRGGNGRGNGRGNG